MSLLIDASKVTAILLADGWHSIKPGSFYLDSYEVAEEVTDSSDKDPFMYHVGGASGISATGFSCTELSDSHGPQLEIGSLSGPFTSVLALRH